MTKYTYLALGDSYTIGEQVPAAENFPNQTVDLLNQTTEGVGNNPFYVAPDIIAKTGWTTDELNAAIDAVGNTNQYDIVSLLIGVNNQYRDRPLINFELEFEGLLKRAIEFAGGHSAHVFVLSIPDWGVTPFANGKDSIKIAAEIDAYNAVCRSLSETYNCHYIDITDAQRMDSSHAGYLAGDGLHPSGKEYAKWAIKLAKGINKLNG